DILLFPTLCDGFGMVLTEALAHGLPVLTTTRAGSADFIEHEKNGLIVEPANADALVEAFDWCATHRDQLGSMRRQATETAAGWQWEDFRRGLVKIVQEGAAAAGK